MPFLIIQWFFGQSVNLFLDNSHPCVYNVQAYAHLLPRIADLFYPSQKKTPVIAGRSRHCSRQQSLANGSYQGRCWYCKWIGVVRSRFLGKLSGFSPITLYLHYHSWSPHQILVNGKSSMADLKYFLMNQSESWAGIHTLPFSLASTSSCTFITVSRSVATTVNLFFCISNKKSSNIGNTVFALITRWYAATF